jgi:replicative DNA helicase
MSFYAEFVSPVRERGFATLTDHVATWRERSANPLQRIPLGLPAIDRAIVGIAAGEVCTVIARSGVGKSLLATHTMFANPSVAVLFFSLEMPATQVMGRLYSQVVDMAATAVEMAALENKLPLDIESLGDKLPFQVVVDTPAIKLQEMSAYLENYASHFGRRPELVIVDYLEELSGLKSTGGVSAEGVAALSSQVRIWAATEKVALLMIHQTNVGREAWESPTRSSARYGGYTESDFVIGLWRPGFDPELKPNEQRLLENEVGINVIKNRPFGRNLHHVRYALTPSLRLVELS